MFLRRPFHLKCLFLGLLLLPWQNHCFMTSTTSHMAHSRSDVKLYRQNVVAPLQASRAADDLNPIEIDDVMSEVEMALREADSALRSRSTEKAPSKSPADAAELRVKDELNPIEIDDVMSEVAMALKEADSALTGSSTIADTPATSPSSASTNTDTKITTTNKPVVSLDQLQDIISTSMGGVVLGTGLGALTNYQLAKMDSIDTLGIDPSIPPIALAAIFGTVGVAGALSTDTQEGKIVKMLLGTPTTAAVTALTNLLMSLLEALGLAAKRKVEETASEIKAIPGKVANSARVKAKETAEDIINIPNRVGNAAKNKATETIDDVKASVERTVDTIVSLPKRTMQELTSGESNQVAPLLIVPLVAATGIFLWTSQFSPGL